MEISKIRNEIMENVFLNATVRETTGRKVKNLRNKGLIPAIVYGRNFDNIALQLDKSEFTKLFKSAGSSTIVTLKIKDKEDVKVLIHEPQYNPVTDEIVHADLYKVDMKQELQTEIPLNFIGESLAVVDLEGNLITNKDALEVKCLPEKLVSELDVDISSLKTFEDIIKVSDVKVPEGIEVLDDPDEVIAQVTPPRSEEELEEMETPATGDEEKAAIESMEAAAIAEKAEGEEETKENDKQ